MRLLFLTLFIAVSVAFPTNAGSQVTPEAPSADEICGQVAEGTPAPAGATTADPGTLESTMKSWRSEWYPGIPTLAPDVLVGAITQYLADSPGRGGAAGLEEMGPEHDAEAIAGVCGSDVLDLAFIDALTARNSASLVLMRNAADITTRREIRELALSQADSQQFEIDQVLAWREQWFPDASPPAHDSG
jgi:hypothetical protein